MPALTEAQLERIRTVRGAVKGWNTEKITKEDVSLLLARIDDLDLEEYRNAEELARFMLRRMEEELKSSRSYLEDMIEQTRCAELMVREAEHGVAAIKHLLEGAMFFSADEIDARWNAMADLYRSQGMLPEPEPVEAVEPPVEALPSPAEPEPAPEPTGAACPPELEATSAPAKAPWGSHTRQRDAAPVTPEDPEAAVLASLKAAAGDKPEIQISLSVLAAHSGVPKGSLNYTLKQLAFANRIEIIRPENTKGTKPPNTYRFVVEAQPEPPKVEEPQAEIPASIRDLPTIYDTPRLAPTATFEEAAIPPEPVRKSFAKPNERYDAPIRDRIVATLRKAACTTSGLASMLDVKELAICQTLTAMEHEGSVKPDEMPEAGRRAQLWRLADAA